LRFSASTRQNRLSGREKKKIDRGKTCKMQRLEVSEVEKE